MFTHLFQITNTFQFTLSLCDQRKNITITIGDWMGNIYFIINWFKKSFFTFWNCPRKNIFFPIHLTHLHPDLLGSVSGQLQAVAQRWRSEPMDIGLSGPLSILHNLIPLTPPPHKPLLRLCTRLSLLYEFKYCTFQSVHISLCIMEIWVPLMTWWGKWGPLMTQW